MMKRLPVILILVGFVAIGSGGTYLVLQAYRAKKKLGIGSDAKLAGALLGTWEMQFTMRDGTTVSRRSVLMADGREESLGWIKSARGTHEFRVAYKWSVEDGHILWEVTDSSVPSQIPIGVRGKDRILALTDTELRCRLEDGTEVTKTRVRESAPAAK